MGARSPALSVVGVLLTLAVLAGCDSFQPFATPVVPRPALPRSDAFPHLMVEEAVEKLEALGLECHFAPETDLIGAPGWTCMGGDQPRGDQGGGDQLQVSIFSDETGPVSGAFSVLTSWDQRSQEAFDQLAADTFQEAMLSVFVPEGVHPAGSELLEMVEANWPAELGSGWLLGFDRNIRLRQLNIVFSEAEAEEVS